MMSLLLAGYGAAVAATGTARRRSACWLEERHFTVASAARRGTAAQPSSSPPDFPSQGRQVKGTLRALLRDRHSPILDRHPLNG
jgi:hypothetical protein